MNLIVAMQGLGRAQGGDGTRAGALGLLALGWLAMYVPTYWAAGNGLWRTDEHGHGPIVLLVALWLFWQARESVARAAQRPAPWAGTALFALGLASYGVGRVYTISSLEFASQLFVVAGGLLLLRGPMALRAAWFAVIYLAFTVPLPNTVVDVATGPLKHWISVAVVELLFSMGYPVARTGVVISVGPYQLLVADACSGLNSMISLAALGALYMHVMRRRDPLHNLLLALSIVPIAMAANMVRVVALVLITYHFGDEAGQGFLHGVAGIVLMLVALAALIVFDQAVRWLIRWRRCRARHGFVASVTLP